MYRIPIFEADKMARARMSKDGTVTIPKSVRDAHGLTDGAEFEVIDGGRRIVFEPVPPVEPADKRKKKLTVAEFLAFLQTFPKYEGPPVTDEMMHESINQAAIEDWERLERQWNENKDD